jgi:NADH-quinone oxidoreductase subunit J
MLLAQETTDVNWATAMGLPIVLGAVGYLLAVASPLRRKSVPAGVCLLCAAVSGWVFWWAPGQPPVEGALCVAFAALMVACGCGMQVEANPVYAALWFALVILSTCGLFLMEGAAFISAATIIVYAGAIIVTFLFVIMLARQTGSSLYDRRFRNPVVSIALGAVLLAVLIYSFNQEKPASVAAATVESQADPVPATSETSTNEQPAAAPGANVDTVRLLGRTLLTDYLWSMEIAGVLLLIATFGTIMIALQTREDAA